MKRLAVLFLLPLAVLAQTTPMAPVSFFYPPAAGNPGTVTSIALSVPSPLTVTGSPVTSSGTFTVTWAGLTTSGLLQATSATAVTSTLTPSGLTSIGVNTVTSAALSPLVLATGTFGTAVTFASATGIPTFAGNSLVMAGGSSLTDNASGQLTIAALATGASAVFQTGTNSNLNITTPGTGSVNLNTTNSTSRPTLQGDLYMFNSAASSHGGIEWQYATSNNGYGVRLVSDSGADSLLFQTRANSASWTTQAQVKTTGPQAFIVNNLLMVGLTSSNSNGILQIASSTSATAGIGWGSDLTLYRAAAGTFGTNSAYTVKTAAAVAGTIPMYVNVAGTPTLMYVCVSAAQ